MIKLTMIQQHMDGSTWEQPVRVNPTQIQYYHNDIIGLDEHDVTRIVTYKFDVYVTQTLDEIDLLISEYRILGKR